MLPQIRPRGNNAAPQNPTLAAGPSKKGALNLVIGSIGDIWNENQK